MKGKFLNGTIALLCVSLFLTGCETEVEVPGPMRYVSDAIHVDKVVTGKANLAAAWDDGPTVVEYLESGGGTLPAALTAPEGKSLVLRSSLTPAAAGVTIEGTVYVEQGGTLAAATGAPVVVGGKGALNAGKGTLSIDDPDSVAGGDGGTALGTAKAAINGGTLVIAAVADKGGLPTAPGYVTKGTLNVIALTDAAAKPGEIAAVSGISANRQLVLVTALTGAETSLTIPAGLTLNAGALTLDTVASLTVNGSLTAGGAAGKSDGVAITVGAGGTATAGTIAKLKQSSVLRPLR